MRWLVNILFVAICLALFSTNSVAQNKVRNVCQRPSIGEAVREPADLRSENGILRAELVLRNEIDASGDQRYCYITPDGSQSPNLRLHPGDLLILELKNNLVESAAGAAEHAHTHGTQSSNGDPCLSGKMSAVSTNLHFHGLVIPPTCHQDEVLRTSISPSDTPFEYRIRIPIDQAPGLYWYHPHIHGFSRQQVLGGASGAIIIEGLERTDKALQGLRERVLIIRDQNLVNPNAPPSKNEPAIPQIRVDRDGDVVNTGNGFGKPAKDLSINFVPVPYPDYPPATIEMRPGERQLWRVLNAGTITYLNLQILHDRVPQMLQIVALDGVSVNENGKENGRLAIRNHLGVPPGGRVEFIVDAPPADVSATLVTRVVNTGPGGENDPNRPLAKIVTKEDAPEPKSILSTNPDPAISQSLPWLGDVAPVRTRKLYFSETLQDPKDPNSPTTFFITVDGQTPTPFDPTSSTPAIIAKQGDVEDWIIENRSNELHAFHIHQVHFLMMDWNGIAVNEPFLRDTINVPFFDGKSEHFPSVRLRMDFRAPSVVGTFFFHCHLLEHEDNGMMGLIRVDPPDAPLLPPNPTR